MAGVCGSCGAAAPAQGSFCGQCGAPLPSGAVDGGQQWRAAVWILAIGLIAAMGVIGWLIAEAAATRHQLATAAPAAGGEQTSSAQPDQPSNAVAEDTFDEEPIAPPAAAPEPESGRASTGPPIQPDGTAGETGEYVVFSSIEDKRNGANDEALQLLDQVYACRIHGSINHSSGFPGWSPGYVIVIGGPYRNSATADAALARARQCGLDGYRRAL